MDEDAGDKVETTLLDSPQDNQVEVQPTKHSRCININVFVMLASIFAMSLSFAVNGINNVNIPMYERRFQLSSTETGLVCSTYEIFGVCTLICTGYFVTRFNRPRILALAALSMACGSFIMALPHFTTSHYQPIEVPPSTCLENGNGNGTLSICTDREYSLRKYLYVFAAAQGLLGISGSLLYAIGPAFIDGSVSDIQSPIYLSIFYTITAVGPGVGYVVGGWVLDTHYVDYPTPPPHGQSPKSPAWVGAWWIGFLATSFVGLLLVVPFMAFPKVVPGTEERRKNNKIQVHSNKEQRQVETTGLGVAIKDIPMNIRLLLKNPAFICQCFSGACDAALISGMSTFAAKFLANQFNFNQGSAAILTGTTVVPSLLIGQLVGGVIVRRFKLQVRGNIRFNMVLTILTLCLSATFWIKCDSPKIAGVTASYGSLEEEMINLKNDCNAACECDTSIYEPVCVGDVEFFTACHAGCASVKDSVTKTFSNCSCVTSFLSDSLLTNSTSPEDAVSGKCNSNCKLGYVYQALFSLIAFFIFMKAVPVTTIILRSVNDEQASFALSLQQLSNRALGSIPGPLMIGAVLDSACLIGESGCNGKGSCWIYDTNKMGRNFFLVALVFTVVSLLISMISYKLYKPPGDDNSSGDVK